MMVTRWAICGAVGLFLAPVPAHTAPQTAAPSAGELLDYGVTQDPFLDDQGYLPDMVAPISDSALGPESLIALAASGRNRYAPSPRSGTEVLLIYDLTRGSLLDDPDQLPESVPQIGDGILKP